MQRVDCAGVKDLLARGAQLVDVRTPMEFHQGALPGSVNLPVQAIQRAPRELDPQRPVIVCCRSGNRSAYAKMWLEAMGFREVVDLRGAVLLRRLSAGRAGTLRGRDELPLTRGGGGTPRSIHPFLVIPLWRPPSWSPPACS